jgi:hypothetical protein
LVWDQEVAGSIPATPTTYKVVMKTQITVINEKGETVLKGEMVGIIPVSFVIEGKVYVNDVSLRSIDQETGKELEKENRYHETSLTP